MNNAFIINNQDDVVTVVEPVSKGDNISFVLDDEIVTIQALDDIPKYHKVAIRNIKEGDSVIKYGENIGLCIKDICIGNHVHTTNLVDTPRKEG